MSDPKTLVKAGEAVQIPLVDIPKSTGGYLSHINVASLNSNGVKFERERLTAALARLGRTNPNLTGALLGVGGFFIGLCISEGFQKRKAENEIAFRKKQLSQPIYELKGDEAVNPPWNAENLQEWLYRPVRITGRPMHYRAICIPKKTDNYPGFDYILPLVTRENKDSTEQWGLLLNSGWIPHEYRWPHDRYKLESSDPQTFDGYVTLNPELQGSFLFNGGNSWDAGRNMWRHLYLPDAARTTRFKNQDKTKLALIEQCAFGSPANEKEGCHYDNDMSYRNDYPYVKTVAGALQLKTMPWQHERNQQMYLTIGLISGGIGLAAKLLGRQEKLVPKKQTG
eukprot:TRINITY_DN324_c0_g1_i1.p2 TRINITY_DN324_c0_g1~~TRINITY_DN324_c0_g1_i1.p2  ORF type:complete len:339 (-),score=97.06 TRINITY_DN324_c0_g1_i1:203-1219(-)